VVLMYDRTSTSATVNDCSHIMYMKKNRAIQNIPPTADALLQHSKRTALQARIWQACLCDSLPSYDPCQDLVSYDWGWKVDHDGNYARVWRSILEVS